MELLDWGREGDFLSFLLVYGVFNSGGVRMEGEGGREYDQLVEMDWGGER
jgi:hypothetical protein